MELPDEKTLQRNRRIAVAFGILTVLLLVSLVYGSLQRDKVNELSKIGEEKSRLTDSLRSELIKCNQELNRIKAVADSKNQNK